MNVVSLSAERNSSHHPAKGSWKEILVGTYRSITEDRVLAVAAGVTFYGLLAVFPAIGALVSLYGLFADAATIRDHLAQLSGLLPGGAIVIVGDQIQRVAAAGQGTFELELPRRTCDRDLGRQCWREGNVRCHQRRVRRKGRARIF